METMRLPLSLVGVDEAIVVLRSGLSFRFSLQEGQTQEQAEALLRVAAETLPKAEPPPDIMWRAAHSPWPDRS